jgi:hypothetical protein
MNMFKTAFTAIAVSTFAVACSGAGPETESATGSAQKAPPAAAAPSMIVAASTQTQQSFGIREWRIYYAVDGQKGRIVGLDANGAVVSTETSALVSGGLKYTVNYNGSQIDETMSNGKVADKSGDEALDPLVLAPFEDLQRAPHADSWEQCTADVGEYGVAIVGCILGLGTAETGIGAVIAAAACGVTPFISLQIDCDCGNGCPR